jgi:single-stranded-DNA-specific exonuclease
MSRLPDGEVHDATFTLELNEWNGAVEPRLVLRHAQAPAPAAVALVGEPEDPVEAALAELAAPLPVAGATSRAAGVPRDRRGGGVAGTLAALVASGEPLLVACADARRRRGHLAGRLGGFAVAAWQALERDPALIERYAHVLALDPPGSDAQAALVDERFTVAWGDAEAEYALRAHEAAYDLRPAAAAVYRALRDGAPNEPLGTSPGGAAAVAPALAAPVAPGLADTVAPALGAAVDAASSPAAAGRALRVLDELGLVRLDGASVRLAPARRTELDASAAFRAYTTRLAEGRARLGAPRRAARAA